METVGQAPKVEERRGGQRWHLMVEQPWNKAAKVIASPKPALPRHSTHLDNKATRT